MRVRLSRQWPVSLAVAAVLSGLVASPLYGLAAVVAASAMAAAVLGVRPVPRSGALWSAGVASAGSLCASVAFLSVDVPEPVAALGYVEMAALSVVVGGLVRWAPPWPAVVLGVTVEAAVVALVLRLIAASTDVPAMTAAIACVIFSSGPVGAAACGAYLRVLEGRRLGAVAAPRREQRLALARDLHDFVAHDVSAIVAQAQAGQIVAADPARAATLFAGVEQAGLRALASMDRAIDALYPDARSDHGPPPGLADLPELAERYSSTGPVRVRLILEPGTREVTREAATTVYRIVVEALTNVRRHAPGATVIDVEVRMPSGTGVEVTVTDDGGAAERRPTRVGGLGLPGLAERVRALGGDLTAGPFGAGWRVRAVLPHRTAN